jgi:Fe2+ transport system protein FeoA
VSNSESATRVSGQHPGRSGSHRLVEAGLGILVRVVLVESARRAALAQEGILEGAPVMVERRLALGGPLIVRLGRTRLAVARRVAADVLVEADDSAAVTPVTPVTPTESAP